jgi:uncharacterized protein YukE
MTGQAMDILRVQPEAIPALRAEFKAAAEQVDATLKDLRRRGYLPAPWLGDEVSAEVVDHYNRRAMDDPDSAYQTLVRYQEELMRVHDTLAQMEADYRRTEGDNAALWGRKA